MPFWASRDESRSRIRFGCNEAIDEAPVDVFQGANSGVGYLPTEHGEYSVGEKPEVPRLAVVSDEMSQAFTSPGERRPAETKREKADGVPPKDRLLLPKSH